MLIDDVKSAWRMSSVWAGAAAIAFGSLPPESQAGILAWLHVPASQVPAVLGLVFIFTRLTKQKSVSGQ